MIKLEGDVNKTIGKIEKIASGAFAQSKIDGFCQRLADYGMSAANAAYAETTPEYDKRPNVVYDHTDRSIVASGEDLLFVEFGTGLFQSKQHEKAGEFGFGPGTYSAEHEQWLTDPRKMEIARRAGHDKEFPVGNTGAWTKGNDPAEGMTKAMDAMREHIKEAWNDRH